MLIVLSQFPPLEVVVILPLHLLFVGKVTSAINITIYIFFYFWCMSIPNCQLHNSLCGGNKACTKFYT